MVRHKLVQRIVAAYGEYAERRRGGPGQLEPRARGRAAGAAPGCGGDAARRPGSRTATSAWRLVGEGRMRTLNCAYRGVDEATDVLAFPIALTGSRHRGSPRTPSSRGRPRPAARARRRLRSAPTRPTDVTEAAVHGTLHLCGYDHEADDGEMLALQAKVMLTRRCEVTAVLGSSGWPAGRTSASRPWSTRSSASGWRSSPSARRPPAARCGAWRPMSRRAGSW